MYDLEKYTMDTKSYTNTSRTFVNKMQGRSRTQFVLVNIAGLCAVLAALAS